MITYIRMRKLLRLLGIIPQENKKIIMIHHDILVILYKYQPIFILKNSDLFTRTTLWFVKPLMTLQCFWFANLCDYLNVLVYRLPGLEIKSWFRMADCKAYNQSILKPIYQQNKLTCLSLSCHISYHTRREAEIG